MTKSKTPGIARIVLLIGGTCAEMARYVKSLSADLILWIDVLNELERVKAGSGVIRLVLAPGKTLATLFEGLPENEHLNQIRKYLETRPGVDVNIGLAQCRFAGQQAAKLLVATPEFRSVLEEIFSKVLILHNGTIEKVELDAYSSGCGGTGGPGGGPIVKEIARYYRSRHRAVVDIRFNRAGSLSFEGLGKAIHRNISACVCEDLAFTLLAERALAEVRSLTYFELPMFVKNKAERDRCMATLVQALNSPEYRQLRDLSAPNIAAHSELGSISLIDVGWFRELGADRVRLNVANRFSEILRRVLSVNAAENVLERIEVAAESLAPTSDTTVPQLVERLRQSRKAEPAGLLDSIENVAYQHSGINVFAHLCNTGRTRFGDSWRERCTQPCRTVAEFSERFRFLRALSSGAETEIRARTEKINRLQNQRRQTKASLSTVKDEYYPKSLFGKLTNQFADLNERSRRFENLAKSSRETVIEIGKLEAENVALRRCLEEVQTELSKDEQRLRAVMEVLAKEGTHVKAAGDEELVEISDIDDVLEQLLQIVEMPTVDREKFGELLQTCATRATLAGLAYITGAHEPRIDLVIRKLKDNPSTIGPYWGGKRPLSVDSTVFVLPPVANDLREALVSEFARQFDDSEKSQSVFSETAEAGVNIVRLQIRHPKAYSEICTPPIADEFEKIIETAELYLEEGFPVEQAKHFFNGACKVAVPVSRPR